MPGFVAGQAFGQARPDRSHEIAEQAMIQFVRHIHQHCISIVLSRFTNESQDALIQPTK